MSRDYRFRVSGLSFFVILLLHFVFSSLGRNLLLDYFSNTNKTNIIVPLLPIVISIFSSEMMGFVFSSIAIFIYNRIGGYSRVYNFDDENLITMIDTLYNNEINIEKPRLQSNDYEQNFFDRFTTYNTEQKFIYLLWHTKEGVNEELQQWIERRFTAFFSSFSFVIAIIFSNLIAFLLLINLKVTDILCEFSNNQFLLGKTTYCFHYLTNGNYIVLITTIVISTIMIWNGINSLLDARRITDMQIAKFFFPKFNMLSNKINSKGKNKDNNISKKVIYKKSIWRK